MSATTSTHPQELSSRRLTGETAVVTGAGRGIGLAIATRLAQEGAAVALLDREGPEAAVKELTAAGLHVAGYEADVSDPNAVHDVKRRINEDLGAPGIVVNNAGIYPVLPLADVSIEDWRRVFAVNVESALLTIQAFSPAMKEAGWGRIINIASNSIALQVPDAAPYISSKMALMGLTRSTATELAPYGITANAVAPTVTRTPGMSAAPDELLQRVADTQTIKRVGQPEDLVGAVAFLASRDAGFITAQTLYVDGGLVRS